MSSFLIPLLSLCSSLDQTENPRSTPILQLANSYPAAMLFWFSRSVVSDSLRPHGLQHSRLSCPSLSPGACSNSCLHRDGDAIQPSHPLSSPSPPAFSLSPAPASFLISRLIASGGQRIGTPASAVCYGLYAYVEVLTPVSHHVLSLEIGPLKS